MEFLAFLFWFLCIFFSVIVGPPGDKVTSVCLGLFFGPFGLITAAILGNRPPPTYSVSQPILPPPDDPATHGRAKW